MRKEKTKVNQKMKILREVQKTTRGITLIALVVTIIVLLILAAVAINLTLGNNGIFTRAQIAVVRNENASVYEQLQFIVADYQMNAIETGNEEEILERLKIDGYVEEDAKGNNILNVENLMGRSMQTGKGSMTDGDVYVIEKRQQTASSDTSDITIRMDYHLVYYDGENIDIDLGLAFSGNLSGSSAWNEIFETAEKHPEQSETNETIGIDSWGNPVNMDLWNSVKIGNGYNLQGEYPDSSNGYRTTPSYKGRIIEGKIEGEIPKYIKKSNDDKFYPVVSLSLTFAYTNIIYAPEIPDTVESMSETFLNCKMLSKAPVIPSNVTNMYGTFSGCTNLYEAPVIPNSVTNMEMTFNSCTNLREAPAIPSGVTDMTYTFANCTNLTKAPVIPNNVTYMSNTFNDCSNLTGTLEINANPNSIYGCLTGASTTDNANLVLTGSSTMLQSLLNTADENSHITIQQ